MLAPAKINLSLSIVGKRADGYHRLQSLVMFADIGDSLTLTPADDFSFVLEGEYKKLLKPELAEDNLVVRAALALAKKADIVPKGALMLHKNLPIGAGLGGGSADAAAALRLLNEYWQLGYSLSELAAIGATLGSDIPACLYARPLWLEGAGEELAPCDIAFDLPVLLVYPAIHVATKEVYARLSPPYAAVQALPKQFADIAALLAFLEQHRNDLVDASITIAPTIAMLLAEMEGLAGGIISRMSGSGSACFTLFDSREDCGRAALLLASRYPNYWVQSIILRGSHHG